MPEWIKIGNIDEFPENEAILVEDTVYGSVVVVNQSHSFFVLSGICSHEHFELGGSPVQDGQITCMLHLSAFNLEDGEVQNPPAEKPLESFSTKIENKELWIKPKKDHNFI